MLIISVFNVYGDNLVKLDNGIVNKRIVIIELIKNECYVIFDYFFYENEELLE